MYKLLIVAALAAICAANQQCPANEEYQECGTACPTTCANRHEGPRPCMLICVKGCFCKQGFFRNSEGVCVRDEECDGHSHVPLKPSQECGANAHYTECGSVCPLTCRNRHSPHRFCSLRCAKGCQCDEGFMRNGEAKCVREKECEDKKPSQQCPANEEYQECGTACPATCANRHEGPRACVLKCVMGCFCQNGFFRNSKGVCVREEECDGHSHVPLEPSQECGVNAHFSKCGPVCPVTCGNRNLPKKCHSLRCKVGCKCNDGYVMNGKQNGQCVKESECDEQ